MTGQEFKAARESLRLSVAEMAAALGVHPSTIYTVERKPVGTLSSSSRCEGSNESLALVEVSPRLRT